MIVALATCMQLSSYVNFAALLYSVLCFMIERWTLTLKFLLSVAHSTNMETHLLVSHLAMLCRQIDPHEASYQNLNKFLNGAVISEE